MQEFKKLSMFIKGGISSQFSNDWSKRWRSPKWKYRIQISCSSHFAHKEEIEFEAFVVLERYAKKKKRVRLATVLTTVRNANEIEHRYWIVFQSIFILSTKKRNFPQPWLRGCISLYPMVQIRHLAWAQRTLDSKWSNFLIDSYSNVWGYKTSHV